jgi:hypothetical protein
MSLQRKQDLIHSQEINCLNGKFHHSRMFHSTANVFPDGKDFVRGIYGVVVKTPPMCVATTSGCCMLFEASTVEYQVGKCNNHTNITFLFKDAGV